MGGLTRSTLHSLSAKQHQRTEYAHVGASSLDFDQSPVNQKHWLIALATTAVVGFFITGGALIGVLVRSEL